MSTDTDTAAAAIALITDRAVYDGTMCVQTDAGRLAHSMVLATSGVIREWARDGSDPSTVSVRWVMDGLTAIDGLTATDAADAAAACIAYVVERSAARRAAQADERRAAQAEADRARDAATQRQLAYIASLTAHPEVMSMVRGGLTKRAASQLIEDIRAGELG